MGFILFIVDLIYAAQFIVCKFFLTKLAAWALKKGVAGVVFKIFTFFKPLNKFPGMLIILVINVLLLIMMIMSRRGKKLRNGSIRSVGRGATGQPASTNVIIGPSASSKDDYMNIF